MTLLDEEIDNMHMMYHVAHEDAEMNEICSIEELIALYRAFDEEIDSTRVIHALSRLKRYEQYSFCSLTYTRVN